jgi:hypothetical protein
VTTYEVQVGAAVLLDESAVTEQVVMTPEIRDTEEAVVAPDVIAKLPQRTCSPPAVGVPPSAIIAPSTPADCADVPLVVTDDTIVDVPDSVFSAGCPLDVEVDTAQVGVSLPAVGVLVAEAGAAPTPTMSSVVSSAPAATAFTNLGLNRNLLC